MPSVIVMSCCLDVSQDESVGQSEKPSEEEPPCIAPGMGML